MPKIPKSANKAKTFLYPEEDAKLLGCADVQIERRLVYGILAREGMRASELEELKWRDVDLEHRCIWLDEKQDGRPARVGAIAGRHPRARVVEGGDRRRGTRGRRRGWRKASPASAGSASTLGAPRGGCAGT